jgi:SEC-C motif-containing protein
MNQACLCGSGLDQLSCCSAFLSGEKIAETPEAMMRSRYTAFCLNDLSYLKKTWHPETLPDDLDDSEPSNWLKLDIIASTVDGDQGEVEFKAKLLYNNKLEVLHERSDFERVDGVWLYHSGEFLNDGKNLFKIKKSEPCPCGSGKLFKNCHINH